MAELDQAELRTLLDRAQIHDALMRYCRGVDRGDSELVLSALHPDATIDLRRGPIAVTRPGRGDHGDCRGGHDAFHRFGLSI